MKKLNNYSNSSNTYSEHILKENKRIIEEINLKFNELTDNLYKIQLFENEFQILLDLTSIVKYLIDYNHLSKEDIIFLIKISNTFQKFFDLKIKYQQNVYDNKKAYGRYMLLINNFRNLEQYFYINIYSHSKNYDEEFLDQISNLLSQ